VDVSSYLDWRFFTPDHGELVRHVDAWATAYFATRRISEDRDSVDHACRQLVSELGRAGLTRYCVPAASASPTFDVRSLALIRETLARHDALADFAFAMQGLGSGAISLAGSAALKERYLPRVASGEAIAAFALSEAAAGSDVAAIRCRARRDGDSYILDGEKT